MGVKRIVAFAIAFGVVAAALLLNGRKTESPEKKIHVYTWSNYFPDAVLEDFKKKTGIRVELSYFSSSEELYSKLKAGATGYDVIQPSDYMVRQMVRSEMLTPLDHTQLRHLNHLEDFYKNPTYDLGLKFSVPYILGTTGIAVNTDVVNLTSDDVSWGLLFNSPVPRQTSLLEDMREVFAGVLAWKGRSINSRNVTELTDAKKIIDQVKTKILTFTTETRPLLLRGEVAIAHAYSVDALQAMAENPKIKYFIPREGGTIWTDNFAIPKSAKHIDAAHTFIDYFLEPQNALRMAREYHLTLPNKTVKLELLTPEERSNPNRYPPPEILKRLHFLDDLGESLNLMNNLWTELKS